MPLNSQINKLLRLLLCLVFLLSAALSKSSYAGVYEGVRDMSYDSNKQMCANNDYASNKFDPIIAKEKTSSWELTNANCAAFAGSYGAALVAQEAISRLWACKSSPTNTPAISRGAPAAEAGMIGPPLPPYPSPGLPIKAASFVSSCALFAGDVSAATAGCIVVAPSTVPNNPYLCGGLASATADQAKCCTASAVYASTIASAFAALNVIWDRAKITYENARVCGHNWNEWKIDSETDERIKDKGPYQICLKQLFEGDGKIGSNCSDIFSKAQDGGTLDKLIQKSKNCLDFAFSSPSISTSDIGASTSSIPTSGIGVSASGCSQEDSFPSKNTLENKYYREYIYGGIEFEDNGDNACRNPWKSEKSKRIKYLGYDSDNQRYYMTGSGGSAPVFACHRFLSDAVNEDTQKAYDCCKKRSQTTMCIENKAGLGNVTGSYKYKFCSIGEFCDVAVTKFEVYSSKIQSNYICAKTYSLCPYNHLLGGGTEEKKISSDPKKYGAVENYCQYMNHCTKVPILPYVYSSNLTGAWVSGACRNLKGDSQNVYGFSTQITPTNTRHFSAPIAQCFKESVANIFLNRAGVTKCESPSESPDRSGYCSSGYVYKKGDLLPGDSFFAKIQKNLKTAIQMGLIVSVIVFGYSILLAVPKTDTFNKKALLGYIVKLSLVMYFAIGNAWQYGFMDGVLGFSGAMSDLVFKLDESGDPATLDGCQFPRFDYADANEETRYNNPKYPPGAEYLRIWDTLDCKLARALGYGPEVSVPNLIFMILGGFLDFGAGILFVLGSLMLAFVMIMVVCRSLHIFLMSTTAVILLLYVSPITITCAMFARTKGIFDGWKKQLMGISLQPMILFAYIAVMISVFDNAIIGEVRFSGDGKSAPKKIICDNSGIGDVLVADPAANGKLNSSGNNTSIYCIFRTADIKTFHGLEVIGIGLPVLMSMTKAKVLTIIKSTMIMFIFLQFLDKISSLANALVGGANIDGGLNAASVGKMARGLGGAMKSMQDRGLGAMKRVGEAAVRKGGEAYGSGKGAVRAAGKKDKKSGGGGGGGGDEVGLGDHSAPGGSAVTSGAGDHSAGSGANKPEKFKPTLESISEEDGEGEDDDKEPETVQRPTIPSVSKSDEIKGKVSEIKESAPQSGSSAIQKKGEVSESSTKESSPSLKSSGSVAAPEGKVNQSLELERAPIVSGGGATSIQSSSSVEETVEEEVDQNESEGGKEGDSNTPETKERPVMDDEDSRSEKSVESSESTTMELPKASDEGGSNASQQAQISESFEEISSDEEPSDSDKVGGSDSDTEPASDNVSDSGSDSGDSTSSRDSHYSDSTISSRAKERDKSDKAPEALKKGSGTSGDKELFSKGSTPNLNQSSRIDTGLKKGKK